MQPEKVALTRMLLRRHGVEKQAVSGRALLSTYRLGKKLLPRFLARTKPQNQLPRAFQVYQATTRAPQAPIAPSSVPPPQIRADKPSGDNSVFQQLLNILKYFGA